MKAKSKLKSKRDNETPEKYLSDESQRILLDGDINNNSNESYSELRITEETLQMYKSKSSVSTGDQNVSTFAVRYTIPEQNRKLPTKKICILKKASPMVPAIPSSSLLDQNNLRFDTHLRPVQHSILGSVDEYFKMCLNKQKLTLNEIPAEYHHLLGNGAPRRPFSVMFPSNNTEQENMNVSSNREKSSLQKSNKSNSDFDTKALKLWEERMLERKKLQNHISKQVDRVPEKMVFNSAEGFRETLEKHYLISRSIPFYGSGYGFRVGSEFWQQNEVVGIDPLNCLHMTNTPTEKGYPPPILHVGVTNKIKEEKGVPISGSISEKQREDYDHDRFKELNEIILELDPHQPEFSNLMVVGNKIEDRMANPNENTNDLSDMNLFPQNIENTIKNEQSKSSNLSQVEMIQRSERTNDLSNGPCLFINSLKLENKHYEHQAESKMEIRLLFNGYAKDKLVETLLFQNRGTSVIRYWWKKCDSYDPFDLDNKDIRRFYFNTEDGILLPNQDLSFPIIFKSEKSGVFSEIWKIETLPALCEGKEIAIYLKGVALQRDLLASTRKNIDIYLKYQVAENICRSIVDDIIQGLDQKVPDMMEDDFDINSEREQFTKKNKGITFNIDHIHSFKTLNEDLASKEMEIYDHWEMDCGILRKNIVMALSLKTSQKEEMLQNFYKIIDEAMIPNSRVEIFRLDLLYRIGYRNLLDFFTQMVDGLNEIRKFHEIPEKEIPLTNLKTQPSVSRRQSNSSQNSKKQKSATTKKSKSKEPRNSIKEPMDGMIADSNEVLGIDEATANDSETLLNRSTSDVDINKYRYKSYQMVYSLLDKALDSIIESWGEVGISDI